MSEHFRDINVKAVNHHNRCQRARNPEKRLPASGGRKEVHTDDSNTIEHVERHTQDYQQLEPVQLLRHRGRLGVFLRPEKKGETIQEDMWNEIDCEQNAREPLKPEGWLTLVFV